MLARVQLGVLVAFGDRGPSWAIKHSEVDIKRETQQSLGEETSAHRKRCLENDVFFQVRIPDLDRVESSGDVQDLHLVFRKKNYSPKRPGPER